MGNGDSFRIQQDRHPSTKAVHAKRLKKIEERQHNSTRQIFPLEHLAPRTLFTIILDSILPLWGWQFTLGFSANSRLKHIHNIASFLHTALAFEPARRFGEPSANKPDNDSASGADNHDP